MLQNLKAKFYKTLHNLNIEYKRYFFDRIDFNEKLIGIIGARGIGKTTFLLQYIKEHPLPIEKKLYINSEFLELYSLKMYEVAEEFEKEGGKLLIFDEIHRYVNFEKELKLIYDTLDIKVIFSGSSAIKLEYSKSDLSRRAILYRVKNLSFSEFLEIKTEKSFTSYSFEEIISHHTDIAFEINSKIKPFEFWKEYLEYGAYPFYFETSKRNYYQKLQETINATIEFDIPFIFNIEPRFIIKLKQLVYLICKSEPYELNITKLAQKIDIDRKTLYQYIHYLEQGNVFNILKSKSRGDSLFVKPQKIYLYNSNINYSYCEEQKIGTIRETFIVNQLKDLHQLEYPKKTDLIVENKYILEIGGKNKTPKQLEQKENAFLLLDDIEYGYKNQIPLWLFGFLY